MWLAKFGKRMLFSVEQAFVVRDERRAPLKTLAYEPRTSIKGLFSLNKKKMRYTFQKRSKKMLNRIRGQILPARSKSHRKSIKMYAWNSNFMTSNCIKTSGKTKMSQNCEPSRAYSTRQRKWLEQAAFHAAWGNSRSCLSTPLLSTNVFLLYFPHIFGKAPRGVGYALP